MKNVLLSFFLGIFSIGFATDTSDGRLLWEIGERDNRTSEFVMASGDYEEFSKFFTKDPVYCVGRSTPENWSYWHPGPLDGHSSGKRGHDFIILFGIAGEIEQGDCKFVIDMVDTHRQIPPVIEIVINGRSYQHQLDAGGGDGSISGDFSKAKESLVEVNFPSSFLRKGPNDICIKSLTGSWFLYDWVGLYAPASIKCRIPESVTRLLAARDGVAIKIIDGKSYQSVECEVLSFGKDNHAKLEFQGEIKQEVTLTDGVNEFEFFVPAADEPKEIEFNFISGDEVVTRQVLIEPLRKWEIYLLPHSHVDIGYTHEQEEVLKKQKEFIDESIALSKASADNPAGSVFKWNVEVLWAVEDYLKTRSESEIQEFFGAVKKGWIGLDALYGNQHTGLARPEELFQTVQFAKELNEKYGLNINTAMISDVPGYTWGIVPVLVQSGIKYMSWAPNGGAHLGEARIYWDNKPFYWVSPSGKEKLLCWQTNNAYYPAFHNSEQLRGYIRNAQKNDSGYPYDMLHIRYTTGDNGGPSKSMVDFVAEWNSKYDYPKLVIATTGELFRDFEKRYGDKLPEYRGDFTPYWEDGAASTARETALNRNAAERLVQAETMWTMIDPANYPADEFTDAWRNVLLFTEHTWGAGGSISDPDSKFTKKLWAWKAGKALDADRLSRKLLDDAASKIASTSCEISKIQVFNTLSWSRTDRVTVAGNLAGDVVKNEDGKVVPSQRLNSGQLVFLAENIPAFGSRIFSIHSSGKIEKSPAVKASITSLSSKNISLKVDQDSGAICDLRLKGLDKNLVDPDDSVKVNDYYYVLGDGAEPVRDSQVTIQVKESGPMFSTLSITSEAPGCNMLTREITLYEHLDRIDIKNILDRKKVREHEGVHIGFNFNVPDGKMLMDIPWAVIDPMIDQLPGANKMYFCVNRWVDISNDNYGITWVSLDAPLVEKGGINIVDFNPPWYQELNVSNTFYSYVMNNYWWTNFKADQEGITEFRYSIKPHRVSEMAEKQKFGISCSQPLFAVAVDYPTKEETLPFKPDNQNIIVTRVKPVDGEKALMVRYFNTTGEKQKFSINDKCGYESCRQGRNEDSVKWPMELEKFEIVTMKFIKKN